MKANNDFDGGRAAGGNVPELAFASGESQGIPAIWRDCHSRRSAARQREGKGTQEARSSSPGPLPSHELTFALAGDDK
jgi:hypothetical protein